MSAPSQIGMKTRMEALADLIDEHTSRALDRGDWPRVQHLDERYNAVEDRIMSEREARR